MGNGLCSSSWRVVIVLGAALALAACGALLDIDSVHYGDPGPDGGIDVATADAPDAAKGEEASAAACSPAPWSLRAGAALDQAASAIAVGSNGDIIVAGTFSGTLDLGTPPVTSPSSGDAGTTGSFVAKLDALGRVIWARAAVPEKAELDDAGAWTAGARAADVAVDAMGNVWVVGDVTGHVVVGDMGLDSNLGRDVMAMKLDASGRVLWAKAFGSDGDQFADALGIDSRGVAFVGGASHGTIQFPDGPFITGQDGAFTMELDADGKVVWGRGYAGSSSGTSTVTDIGLDPASGRILVLGAFTSDLDLGAGVLSAGLLYQAAFLASLDPSTGIAKWSEKLAGDGTILPAALAVDPSGAIVVTGAFAGYFDFGDGTRSAYELDMFVAKRDRAGGSVWSTQFGDHDGSSQQLGTSIAVDARGQILVSGFFDGSVDFGDGRPPFTGNGADMFLAFLDPAGALVWKRRFGADPLRNEVSALAFDPCGNPLMAGTFSGKLDVVPPLTSVDGVDLFLARTSPTP